MKSRILWTVAVRAWLAAALLGACGSDDDGAGTGGNAGSGANGGTGGTGTAGGTGGTSGSGATGGATGKGGAAGNAGGTGTGGAAGQGGSGVVADAGTGARSGAAGGTADAGRTDAARDVAVADARDAAMTPPDVVGDVAAECGLASVLSKSYFDSIFPLANRNAVFTYEGLLAAAASYPAFANAGTVDSCRQETAAFLANVARETGRLRYAEEIAKSVYCSTRTSCICDANTTDQTRWYYGRGAIQLTWNYNYCSAGSALMADLLARPSQVHLDPEYAWATALWYWMTSKGGSTMTCHEAMTGAGAFGDTIRAINGGECGKGGYGTSTAVTERVDAYIQFAKGLGIANPGLPADLDC